MDSDGYKMDSRRIPNTSQDDRYHEFVSKLKKESPVETEFKVGQNVAFVNEYGVIFDDLTIIGFASDDSFYGQFVHLNKDSYWEIVGNYCLKLLNIHLQSTVSDEAINLLILVQQLCPYSGGEAISHG